MNPLAYTIATLAVYGAGRLTVDGWHGAHRIIAAWNRAAAVLADAPDVNDDIGTASGEQDERLIAPGCQRCGVPLAQATHLPCSCATDCGQTQCLEWRVAVTGCPRCDKGIPEGACECEMQPR